MPLQQADFSPPPPPRAARSRLAPLALALAALLPGCASLPAPDAALPETPMQAAWSTPGADASGAAAASLAAWWQRFNDAQLSALVTQALQANTNVRTAQAALRQARALRDVSAAGLGPALNTSASAQRSKAASAGTSNLFKAGFDASWEPDVFGGSRSALNATEADARASEASLADTQVSIAAEVAVAYIQLRGLQTQLGIAQRNLVSQNETLQITRWQAQAGLSTSLEVEQALTSSEQTSATIPVLQTSLAKARHSLAVLTGQTPDALEAALADSRPVPQAAAGLALAIPA
ncbi:TolC family protein, partial [Polaromonas sp.]|uniref:TolC family protein n=1 Tax=Polaromonas sp. TaxID=1869339 RepID=UPI003BB61D13